FHPLCTLSPQVSDLKFSPDGRLLGVASHDKRLYAYEAWGGCLSKPRFAFNKHSSAVLHLDFSQDGLYFQSNCQASELLFGSQTTGRQETSASKLADYNGLLDDEYEGRLWASQTCKLGWAVQGIWPPGSDTSDINAVDRHTDGRLLATADDLGLVKLFRFPCVSEGAGCNSFTGHSSHVTCCRWTCSGAQLLSVGGNDRCVFVWRLREL
ncbi:WD40-repeat-containing domain protein, partial [Ochromonadaceae sp. CCMP2298]